MELRKFKRINNLPKYEEGKPVISTNDNGTIKTRYGGDYGSAITGLTGLAGSIYNAHQYNTTSNELVDASWSSQQYIGDIGYNKKNDIDIDSVLNPVYRQNTINTLTATGTGAAAGAAIGSFIPGLGTAVGGLIGGAVGLIGGWLGGNSAKRKAEEEARLAQQKVDNYNVMSRADAYTDYLQQQQAKEYGDSKQQTLFSADKGKNYSFRIPTSTLNKRLVETSQGLDFEHQNSWVSKGESIWNPSTGFARYISHGPNDTASANLKDEDVVFGSKINPFTGNPIKNDAKPLILALEDLNKKEPKTKGWLAKQTKDTFNKASKPVVDGINKQLSDLADVQEAVTSLEQNYRTDYPKYYDGKPALSPWPNYISSGIGALAAINQYFDASNDTPYRPNTYYGNRYQTRALNELSELRVNPYPIMQQLRDAEARTNYAVNASGGLSTAQKHLSRIASLNNTQQNIANLLTSVQAQNNSYRQAYANAALQYGQSEAQLRQQANQYDLDYYAKSHAARQQGMQTGIYNFLNVANQYAANELKRKQGEWMLNLYWQDINGNSPIKDSPTEGSKNESKKDLYPEIKKEIKSTFAPKYPDPIKSLYGTDKPLHSSFPGTYREIKARTDREIKTRKDLSPDPIKMLYGNSALEAPRQDKMTIKTNPYNRIDWNSLAKEYIKPTMFNSLNKR